MRTEKVYVDKVVYGGLGISRLDSGQIVLTEGALPEETLIVTIRQKKKNYLFGEISQILTAHPGRITPLCPYRQCGGCNFHHADYRSQLEIKEAMLTDLLSRQDTDLATETARCRRPILASKRELGYRQRIRLLVEHGQTGFRKRNSHDLVKIPHCLLAEKTLNNVLSGFFKTRESAHILALSEEVELLFDPEENRVILLLHFLRPPRPQDKKAAERILRQLPQLRHCFFSGKDFAITGLTPQKSGDFPLHYRYTKTEHPIRFGLEIGSFCQVNLQQNEQLIATVVKLAEVQKGERVLDLYCGIGNFSLPLAAAGADILGIEGQGAAIRSAKENAKQAGLKGTFTKAPVEQSCRELAAKGEKFDTVVIDPPRRGAPDLAEFFSRLTRKKLLYISCDPATLMRDLVFLRKAGFHITAFQPVDMFPQTHHIECIVRLEK